MLRKKSDYKQNQIIITLQNKEQTQQGLAIKTRPRYA